MTNEERRKAAEWFRKRAMECPMPATRQMYKIATEALEAPPNDNWEGYSSRLWKNAYERGKTDAEQRWIPVSERLPEEGQKVLCQCQANIYDVLKLTIDGWYHDENHCYMWGFVIAWMPLPESYKAESEKV